MFFTFLYTIWYRLDLDCKGESHSITASSVKYTKPREKTSHLLYFQNYFSLSLLKKCIIWTMYLDNLVHLKRNHFFGFADSALFHFSNNIFVFHSMSKICNPYWLCTVFDTPLNYSPVGLDLHSSDLIRSIGNCCQYTLKILTRLISSIFIK